MAEELRRMMAHGVLRNLFLGRFGYCILMGCAVLLIAAMPDAGVEAAVDSGVPPTVHSGDVAVADAGPEGGTGGVAEGDSGLVESPRAKQLRTLARQVRDFLARKLDVAIDPTDLFDIPLGDEEAVELEARRLAAIVERADQEREAADARQSADAGVADAGITTRRSAGVVGLHDAGVATAGDADVDASPDAAVEDPYADLPSDVWAARVDLDRARLAVYLLPEQERRQLLESHARRQKEHDQAKRAARVTEAEKAARRAAEAQAQALEEARRAKSEAIRLVKEERARLLGIKMQLSEVDATLLRRSQEIDSRREKALEWRRRVREVVDQHGTKESDRTRADQVYAELRGDLRSLRSELGAALKTLTEKTAVPALGDDPLADLDVDRSDVEALRTELAPQVDQLRSREVEQRWELATLLMQQVESLNADRLSLYDHISARRRRALTGFNVEGWDQAVAEGTQVQLVARYHLLAGTRWLGAVVSGGQARAAAVFLGLDLLQILLLVAIAGWGLGRMGPLLRTWRDGLPVPVLSQGSSATTRLHFWLGVLDRVRLPLGWLVVGWLALWILGTNYRHLLEVQLLWAIVAWNLGAIFVVHLIDAIAGRRDSDDEVSPIGYLRLSTLQLIGRTVVLIGLTLSLSALLVGKGTIYSWVFTTCWFLAFPLMLVIVSWWRPTIFDRLRLLRSGDRIAAWVVTREHRWSSFLAALVGGVYLMSQTAIRLGKVYLSEFVVARRILAYLFRRELAKQARLHNQEDRLEPLTEEQVLAFDPEARPPELLPTAADDDVARVLAAIDAPGGGVFAVVGERGGGKSMLLERISRERTNTLLLDCPIDGIEVLLGTLRAAYRVSGTSDEALARAIAARTRSALLIDDAHRLVAPAIGGLRALDRLIALARTSGESCTWVLAFNRHLWPFVQRSRGARPLLDEVIRLEPWSEEQIAALVRQRCGHAGIEPSFHGLIANPSEDELQRSEQLARTAAGFYRLLWDYSEGNPAVALEFWRHSLHRDDAGRVHARLFNAPSMEDLENLPDAAVFTLNAVVQLEPVELESLLRVSRLPAHEVRDSIRYSLTRGYVERLAGRHRVTWYWYRAVTSLLRRRHLQED